MSDPQPEATTTAARGLSDEEIAEIHLDMRRRDHINPLTPRDEERAILDALADWVPDLVAALNAAVTARQQAESIAHIALGEVDRLERERAEARTERARAAEHMAGYARQAERERLEEQLAAERTAREAAERARDEWRARWNLENVARQDAVARGFDFRRELAAERQGRERAEQLHAAAQQHIQVSERYLGQEVEKERQRAERAEQERDDLNQRIREADSDRAVAWQIAQDRGQRAERAEAALTTEREAFRAAAFDVFPALDSGTGELVPDWLHRLCRGCGRDWISDTEHVQTCWVKAFIERWSTDTAPQAAPHEQGEQP